ncbi:MAG: acyltransferase [Deltaproteobacteria bacterium GWA2_45_12]|nr:MAG: acyltransferase [Deltaproteobacteria bacterium GWA2_45_12]
METTLSLIQMSCSENVQENLNKALLKIKEAANLGAQIVCLSELFKSQYFCQTNDKKFFDLAEPIPSKTTDILSQTAKENKIVLVSSLYEVTKEKEYYNTAVVFDADGILLGKYRKNHIPDDLPNHYSELYYFKPGDLGYPVFHTKYGTIGVLVCWDQWYPEAARALANQGAQIIFYPTAIGWPRQEREQDIGKNEFSAWQTIQCSHAIANGVFVAACNRTGKEDHLDFWGGSFVCDPMGVLLKQASHHNEEILTQTVDLSRINKVRKDWPFLDYRRKDLYHQL